MTVHIIKGYLKQKLLSIIVISFAIFLLGHYSVQTKNDWDIIAVVFLISFVQDYRQYKKKVLFFGDLKEKEVTEEEFDTVAFITNWRKKRNKGILKFVLIDGGIILGSAFLLMTACAGFLIALVFSMPIELSSLLGYSCLISACIGISANLFLWPVNEKKFARLKTRHINSPI